MSANGLPVGVLKATPEDFIVQELVGNPPSAVPFTETTVIQGWDGHSVITVFRMSKRRWETQAAVIEVARQLGVSFDAISFHGIKDKHACTSQLVGVRGQFRPVFSDPDISLGQFTAQENGSVELDKYNKLRRGGNWGNRFDILIRSTATELDLAAAVAVPNMFGLQRFGRPGTEQIGRLLLEGKSQEAIKLLLTTPSKKAFLKAKKLAGGSDEGALSHPDFKFSFGFEIQKWQSYLWNKLLQEKVKELGDGVPAKLPLWNSNEQVSKMYRHLWNPSRLNQKVLRLVAMSERPTIVRPANFQAKREALGWRFIFDLPSGAYATVVLSQLFKLEESDSRRPATEDEIMGEAAAQKRLERREQLRRILGL